MFHSNDLYRDKKPSETSETIITRNIQEMVTNCKLNMALLYIHVKEQKAKVEAAKALVLLTQMV